VWRGHLKILAEYKGKPRKEAASNFRLETAHDCLTAHLRKIGMYKSSECTICQLQKSSMDKEHLLYCLKLDTMQKVLKNIMKLLECQSSDEIMSSPSAIGTTTM